MSKLDELIQEYCPKGIELKELGTFCKLLRGKRLTKKELFDDDKYPVYHGGLIPLGYYNKFNRRADQTMVINTGSVGEVVWSDVDFWSSDGTFVVETADSIDDKFLYYFLKTQESYLKTQKREGGVPTIERAAVEKLRVPVPPLEVQKEIVNILDKFTQLEAELSAELEARRTQYSYYRNQLLEFDDAKVEWMTLGEVASKISSGGTPKTSERLYYDGDIPWLRTQEVNFNEVWDTDVKISEAGLNNSSAKMIPANCVIIAMYGATVGKSAINKIPLTTNQACANIQVNPELADYRYVFHWVSHNYANIKALGTGSQTNINAQTVKNFKIPVPALNTQRRIIAILDKFDNLTNSIKEGLPAEIKARREQYEYYRTKLLTFQELQI